MEYTEDDYLMISGIQHFKFCRRQWALIHIEQQWAENVHTVVGELMHKKAHDPYLTEKRKDILIVRALPVSSKSMGVSGECDLVEFHKCEDGIRLHGHRGMYSVYPVEYKKGKSKSTDADRLQVVAQRGLKFTDAEHLKEVNPVVPHAGTWIEITLIPVMTISSLSFPTRERGLK